MARNGRQQTLQRRGRRHRPRQVGQALDQRQPPPRVLVEPRVFDRPRHQRGGVDEELRVGAGELARRLDVQRDDADHLTRLGRQRRGAQRLVLLLLGLRDDLDAGIVERVLGDEHRLVVCSHPSRQSLAGLEPELADQRTVGIGHRPKQQRAVVGIDEVDPAGVAIDRLADQIHDRAQHAIEVERRRHRVDDLVEVPALDGAGRTQLVGHGGCVRNGHTHNRTCRPEPGRHVVVERTRLDRPGAVVRGRVIVFEPVGEGGDFTSRLIDGYARAQAPE